MKNKSLLTGLALLSAATVTSPLMAASATLSDVRITHTMVLNNQTFGGCMARLSISPTTRLTTCAAAWVSLGCKDASGADSVAGYRMLDQAQMAFALKKRIAVTFADAPRVNGHCTATRIDVYD